MVLGRTRDARVGYFQHAANVADRFGQARQRVVGLFLVFEGQESRVTDLEERAEQPRQVDHAAPAGCADSLCRRRRDILDVHVQQSIGTLLRDRCRILADAHRVPDVVAEADPLVERLDPFVGQIGRRIHVVAGTVIVDADFDVVLLDFVVHQWQHAGAGTPMILDMPAALAYAKA